MTIGSSNFTTLSYAEEDVEGTCPTATFQDIAMTGESFQFSKSSITSNNINTSRQVSDEVQTSFEVSGGLEIEISPGNYNDFIEGALWNDWKSAIEISTGTETVHVNAATGVLTASDDVSFDTIENGQYVMIRGFSDEENNGIFKVHDTATLTGTTLTLAPEAQDILTTVLEGDAEAGISVTGQMIRNPATAALSKRHSYFFERRHNDLDPIQYFSFSGCLVNSFSISASASSLLTGSFDFMGQTSEIYNDDAYDEDTNPNGVVGGGGSTYDGTKSNGNSFTAAEDFNGLNAVSHVGNVRINGVNVNTLASSGASGIYFQKIDFSVNNNLRGVQAIGQLGNVSVSPGQLVVEGSMDALFADDTMYRRFISGEEFSLSFEIIEEYTDTTYAGYVFTLPRCTIKSSSMNAGGSDQDLVETMQFSALMDSTFNTSVQIDYIKNSY